MATKAKTDKQAASNYKVSAQQKKQSKNEQQTMEWDKIFANHISDNGLISKIYKECIFSTEKKKAICKDLNIHFFKTQTNGQPVYEKMLDILLFQGNAN